MSNVRRHLARPLCSGRWLPFHARRGVINASPRRRTRCPDGHRGLRELRIVERSNPDEDQVRSSLSLAKQGSATARAEAAVHPIAAVRHTQVVARRTRDLEGRCAKASANRSAACAQVLTIAAPAHARRDWRSGALPNEPHRKGNGLLVSCRSPGSRVVPLSEILFSGVFRTVPPNPSIERTSSGRLRLPAAASMSNVRPWAELTIAKLT